MGRPKMTDEQKAAAREARNNRAEQGSAAEVAPPAPAPAAPMGDSLSAYIKRMERDGIVLVHVTHPQADGSVFAGRFGGIRTSAGAASATYADGTTVS